MVCPQGEGTWARGFAQVADPASVDSMMEILCSNGVLVTSISDNKPDVVPAYEVERRDHMLQARDIDGVVDIGAQRAWKAPLCPWATAVVGIHGHHERVRAIDTAITRQLATATHSRHSISLSLRSVPAAAEMTACVLVVRRIVTDMPQRNCSDQAAVDAGVEVIPLVR